MPAGSGHLSGSNRHSPVSGPVEEVDDDDRQRETSRLVLLDHGLELILARVPEPALPVAGRPVRQHPRVTGGVGVVPQDRGRGAARGDPVVDLRRCLGDPPGRVVAQLDTSDGGVVPEEPVAFAREQERDGDLGVPLDEVDDAALLVEPPVLVLAEAVEVLAVPRLRKHTSTLNSPPRRSA